MTLAVTGWLSSEGGVTRRGGGEQRGGGVGRKRPTEIEEGNFLGSRVVVSVIPTSSSSGEVGPVQNGKNELSAET